MRPAWRRSASSYGWARNTRAPLQVAVEIGSADFVVVMGLSTTDAGRGRVSQWALELFELRRNNIATSAAAMAFVRSLEPSHRASYHWKVAERMIHFAWMSAEDEALAEQAFMIALETDALLIP
jgi:hypothetical protein